MDEQQQANIIKANLHRIMATKNLTMVGLSDRTGLDQRTLRGILSGKKRSHVHTLHRLAEGLGIDVNEFFVDQPTLGYRWFDQQSNPLVGEVVQENPEVFAGWAEEDFDELRSRMGVGGGLTRDGALDAAKRMNRKRQLHERLDVVLESSQSELVSGMIDLAYRQITPADNGTGEND